MEETVKQNLQNEISQLEVHVSEHKKLLENEPNPDMQTLYQDEIKNLKKQIEELTVSLIYKGTTNHLT
jgi:protein subunit release factor A